MQKPALGCLGIFLVSVALAGPPEVFSQPRLVSDSVGYSLMAFPQSFESSPFPLFHSSSVFSDFSSTSTIQFLKNHPKGTPLGSQYERLFVTVDSHASGLLAGPSVQDFGEIAVILNPAVERNIRYFQTEIPERFQEWLTRFAEYQPLVQQIFEEFGLPRDLVYLSLIESGFNPRAYSRARAAGPWQFMKATGQLYNLRVNWYVDERRDPIKSTVAAAQHLRDLYDRFGSWPLAMAAYNAGMGKISRAIRKSGSRDFWKIRRTRYIRRETKDYVPRFMAATIIATDPAPFGFTSNTLQGVHQYEEVRLMNAVHLRSVAQETGVSFDELRRLNPELRRSVVPPDKGGYFLKVPVGTGKHLEDVKDRLARWTAPPPQTPTWYRVRWGDSLSVIASRFGMRVSTLKRLNNLSGHRIRVGDRLQVREKASASVGHDIPRWYRVRQGDSLSVIASRFGMSLSTLKRLNNLSGHRIHVGDRLQVSKEASTPVDQNTSRWYRVRQGDSLWSIAKRFRMTVRSLIDLNNLSGTMIQVGHRLLVSS